jgi:iron(II)-dependent oxidoreductase
MDIRQDYRYTFPHEFIPKDARLSIFSRPTGAKIWIDDELQIQTTPAKFELAPADYSVKVHAKGYLMGEENVTLGPNEERGIELVLKEGDVPPGMVLIPAGRFLMGVNGASPDERPLRQVEVNAFYIDKSEVTNEQFKAVFPQHTFPKGKQLFPVRGISFKQATEYAQAIGKRLPAEEEWEKAARGTDGREYPWGMEFNKDFCNFDDSEAGDVMKVGRFKLGASPYGCLDMAGNVYEWTSSWYQAYPGNADVTKDYGQIFRVLRGGSYRSDRFGVRCARRYYDRMDAVRDDYGLRCAKDVGGGP